MNAASGFISSTNRELVSVARATDQTLTHDTITPVSFSAATKNPVGLWVVGSPTRITIRKPGQYHVAACLFFSQVSATGIRAGYIVKNGATFLAADLRAGIASNQVRMTLGGTYDAIAGDYFEIHAYQSSTANLNLVAQTAIFGITASVEFVGSSS